MKIKTATEEQWASIEQCRLRWLQDEQVAQYPTDTIRATAKKWCCKLGINPPVFIVDSPLIAQIIEANLGANLRANLGANLRDNLEANLEANLWDNLRDNLRDNLEANLRDNLRDNLGANLWDNLRDNLWDNLWANLRDNLRANLRDNLGANLWYWCGLYCNSYAGWFEGGSILGVRESEGYDDFLEWNRHCPIWMWGSKAIYILRRPLEIHWDSSGVGLHRDDGPAVLYSPFFTMWMWRGVRVDEQIVMNPESQTVDQIKGEGNEEVRRIRIERFGWERFIEESGATLRDVRRNDRDTQNEQLYVLDDGTQRFLCSDPSTGRKYALGVPREIDTCERAQDWMSFGLDKYAIQRS